MNAANPTPHDVGEPSLKRDMQALAVSLLSEGKRLAKLLFLSARSAKLRIIDLRHARYRLGRKCCEGNLHRDLFPELFAGIERLKVQDPPRQGSAAPRSMVPHAVRTIVAPALAWTRSVILQLRRYPLLVTLGESASAHPVPALQEEQSRLDAVRAAISSTGVDRVHVAAFDSGVKANAQRLLQEFGPWTRLAASRVSGTFTAVIRMVRQMPAAIAGHWRHRVAGPLRRITRRQVILGCAILTVMAACGGAWAYFEYRPIDESDPVAVARQADRLAAHPGDPAKPADVAGVPDEALMSEKANGRALDICIKAVEFFPEEPRHLFELGRVLFLAGETDEAREFLNEAVTLGHAGAQAYLGRLEDDPQKALAMFKQAAADFPPAAEMAAQMETYIASVFADAGRKADELAAHPDDPTKPKDIKGVPDAALADEAALINAIPACYLAVAVFPEEPRYRYELGRVLLMAGEELFGAIELETASKKEHGAALATFAQIQDDVAIASDFLRRSLKAGFLPAKAMLATIEAQYGPDFEGEGYFYGDVLRAFFDGNREYLSLELWENLKLAEFMNASFKASATDLYDEKLVETIASKVRAAESERAGPLKPEALLQAIATGVQINRSPLYLPDGTQAAIEKDITRLITTYGKDGTVPKQIADGLRTFIK